MRSPVSYISLVIPTELSSRSAFPCVHSEGSVSPVFAGHFPALIASTLVFEGSWCVSGNEAKGIQIARPNIAPAASRSW